MINPDNHHKTTKGSFVLCLKGTRADRILLLFMLLIILFLWFEIEHRLSAGPATAYVYHHHQLLAKYPLPTDETVIHVTAKGELGDSEVEISKQGIRFLASPCTTHYCTLSGSKAYPGSVIACVPNHIMVVLRGSAQAAEDQIFFDAISE